MCPGGRHARVPITQMCLGRWLTPPDESGGYRMIDVSWRQARPRPDYAAADGMSDDRTHHDSIGIHDARPILVVRYHPFDGNLPIDLPDEASDALFLPRPLAGSPCKPTGHKGPFPPKESRQSRSAPKPAASGGNFRRQARAGYRYVPLPDGPGTGSGRNPAACRCRVSGERQSPSAAMAVGCRREIHKCRASICVGWTGNDASGAPTPGTGPMPVPRGSLSCWSILVSWLLGLILQK